MPKAVDIHTELSKLPVLDNRTPLIPETEAEPAFATLGQVDDSGLYAGTFQGESPWERHPRA